MNKELTKAEVNAINNRAAKSGRAVQYFFEPRVGKSTGRRLTLVRARIIHPSLINQL